MTVSPSCTWTWTSRKQAEHYMRKAQEICERAGIDADALVVLPYRA